jgi:lipoprotein-anchoring transpeptidase ErfK/SrfK
VQNSYRPRMGQSVYSSHRAMLLAMTASVALLVDLGASAQAFPFDWGQQRSAPQPIAAPEAMKPTARPAKTAARDKVAAKDGAKDQESTPEELTPKAKGVLTVVISIAKQQLTLYSNGTPIAHSRVSTGQPGHSTPTGVFSVIQKDRWHRSNIYDDAPMFYMQRITWSGVAMHQGVVPNYPASHGCIRLPEAFAKQMWGITQLGARVIIAQSEVTPAPIAHSKLFTLKREPVAPKNEPGNEPTIETKAAPAIETKAAPAIETKGQAAREGGETSAEVVRSAYAALEKAAGVGKGGKTATDAGKLGDPAIDAMAYAIVTPRVTAHTSSEVVRSAYDAFEAPKPRRAKAAAVTDTDKARAYKPGPISVFVSRKEGKLFVRKGFEPIFSAPVTFEQPEQAIGTHVYTALSLKDDNSTMRWNVLSMPGGAEANKKGQRGSGPASNATEALNRINIPQDALDQISELMSPGASLIISDKGLGPETGDGTDFIVLTR